MNKPRRVSKIPRTLPTFIVKCMWYATAIILKIPAKTELEALNLASKKVSRMEGGIMCQDIVVIGWR